MCFAVTAVKFAIILPESSLDDATVACEKIRKAIEDFDFSHNGTQIPITISIGVKYWTRVPAMLRLMK